MNAPPSTLRSNRTELSLSSGVTSAVTRALSRTRPSSGGAVNVTDGAATWTCSGSLVRVCPALSSTVARYCTVVPGASPATSWKTR